MPVLRHRAILSFFELNRYDCVCTPYIKLERMLRVGPVRNTLRVTGTHLLGIGVF